MRLRTPTHLSALTEHGKRIAVVELQGAICFGSAEQPIKRLAVLAEVADWLILDFNRAHVVEASAARILKEMLAAMISDDALETFENELIAARPELENFTSFAFQEMPSRHG